MGNIDQNQFQPINTNNEFRAFQGNNIARNEAIPNGEAQTKYPLSIYTDDKKRWLVTAADEERSKGTGFMLRLKRRWDEQYPEKNRVSKQKTTLKSTHKWTTEMKVNLLKIEERARNRGRGFIKRI